MITAHSYCSGIGAPEIAKPNWRWEFAAEIAPFPRAVLATRFAHKRIWGDFTALRIRHYERFHLSFPDVIVAGTPCQAFSLAGLRKGLADPRGNVTLGFVRHVRSIANAARYAGRQGPVIVWENVPGVLSESSNPFGCFLSGLIGADDPLYPPKGESWPSVGMAQGPWSRVAWRIFDAQHFGLAQRRARVFLVASFGNRADPAQILFERRGVQGDFKTGRKAGEDITGSLTARARGGGWLGTDFECQGGLIPEKAWALQERDAKGADSSTKEGHLIPVAFAMNLRGREGGAMPETDDKASIRAADGGSSRSYIATDWAVRRLTPTECARLQGFPDNHTKIAWRGRPAADCPDGPQYMAFGNAMPVTVIKWILDGVELALTRS